MALERPVRSKTQTTVARWFLSDASSRSSSSSRCCSRSSWARRTSMLSGSAETLAVLKAAISSDLRSSSPASRSTSAWKNSSVSPARPCRSRTFSCSTRLTSSLAPLLASSGLGAEKAMPMMVAPGSVGRRVGSGMKPMNSMRSRMSPTSAFAGIS